VNAVAQTIGKLTQAKIEAWGSRDPHLSRRWLSARLLQPSRRMMTMTTDDKVTRFNLVDRPAEKLEALKQRHRDEANALVDELANFETRFSCAASTASTSSSAASSSRSPRRTRPRSTNCSPN
jgi:hypothetical protein